MTADIEPWTDVAPARAGAVQGSISRRWTGIRETATAAHFSSVMPSPDEALRVSLRVIGPPGEPPRALAARCVYFE
jgi:hypothetical protein